MISSVIFKINISIWVPKLKVLNWSPILFSFIFEFVAGDRETSIPKVLIRTGHHYVQEWRDTDVAVTSRKKQIDSRAVGPTTYYIYIRHTYVYNMTNMTTPPLPPPAHQHLDNSKVETATSRDPKPPLTLYSRLNIII